MGNEHVSHTSVSVRQLLRGVTISNGGVLPRIHPELLSKKRGGRVKADSPASVPEKPEEHSKSKKPVKPLKKVKGKRGRKPKVSQMKKCCPLTLPVLPFPQGEALRFQLFTRLPSL